MNRESKQETIRICDLLESAAQQWPENPAISFQGVTRNWRETLRRCKAAATVFKNNGVSKGDCVAWLGLNSNVLFESYYSPAFIGSILVPVNYRLSLREMIECVQDCLPSILVIDPNFIEQATAIKAACPCITTIIYSGDENTPAGMLAYEEEIGKIHKEESYASLRPSENDETVIIFYTGGTTGRSKGVMLSNRNFQANTDCSIPQYRMRQGWTFIISGPLFHLAAGSRIFSCAALGGHAVILAKFAVEEFMHAIEQYRVDSTTLVPTMLQMILDHPDFLKHDLSSLRMVSYGAAPMPVALLSRIINAFPHVEIFQTYGMTEAAPIVTALDSRYHVLEGPDAGKLGSVGKAVSHVELKIANEEDVEMATGETGEILIRGENIMTAYLNMPEQTAEALRGGWYHTGDAGYLDEEGFLFLEGRVKDMIVSGGENVYPIEVENVLSDHPAIHQVAVIGIPHDTWGEAVHAVVLLKEGATVTEDELMQFCKERIASYKCPQSISFRDEPMPLSAINKILKTELRKPFWEGRSSSLV